MDLPEPVQKQVKPLVRHYSRGLINVDPPAHTRMRHVVQRAFTPRTIDSMADYVSGIVERLIDAVQDQGEMDIIRDLSYPLPINVIAELMGLPVADYEKLKYWSGIIIEFMATPKPQIEVLLSSQDALLELQDYFRSVFKRRRSEPRDDLISTLVKDQDAGDRVAEEELVSTCVTVLIGGHETTTYLISSGMLALMQHPEQMRQLKEHPDMVGTAVEEMLRYEGPFQRNRRLVMEDVELGGRRIEKGQLLVQMMGAANRDPAVFPNPACFDIERQPNKHVSFGYGPHFCVGAPLARLEAPVAINALLRRLPNLEVATDELIWKNNVFRGLESLPVTFG
jgi:cytochrome P450